MNGSFKQCPNGHYYEAQLDSCPYCKSSVDINQRGTTIDFNQTLVQCPKCGQFSPGPYKCIHCGGNLHTPIQRRVETSSKGKENLLNPKLCCFGWYRVIHKKRLETLRKQAEKDFLNATLGSNPVAESEWYHALRIYLDRKTDNIISRRKCYKYGLERLDSDIKAGFYKKGKLGYCHAAWAVQKALIKQEYGLIWYTPQEMEPDTQFD